MDSEKHSERRGAADDAPATDVEEQDVHLSQWVALPDPEGSGDNYYWNQATGETTWEEPPGFFSDTAAPASDAHDAAALAATNGAMASDNTDEDGARALDSGSSSTVAHAPDEEGDAPTEIKRALWYYKDASGEQQGPFPLSTMQNWYSQGFFPIATLARRMCDTDWTPIGDSSDIVAAAPSSRAAAAGSISNVYPAVGLESAQALGGVAAGTSSDGSEYTTTAFFNRHTGRFDEDVAVSMERQQDMYNHRAK
eukprot:COSAG02_NODE_17285_length_1015_cov_1.198690_1_plen_252_part_01